MGLKTVIHFFKTESDKTFREVFGTSNMDEIFEKYDEKTIKAKVDEYVRKLYDKFLDI